MKPQYNRVSCGWGVFISKPSARETDLIVSLRHPEVAGVGMHPLRPYPLIISDQLILNSFVAKYKDVPIRSNLLRKHYDEYSLIFLYIVIL